MESGRILLICVTLVALLNSVYCCEESVQVLDGLALRGSDIESDYFNGGNGIVLNDANLISGWYSTTLYGWQYLMTDVSNKPYYLRCSTYWPIYLKENHTSLDDLREDPTDIIACVRDDIHPCNTQYTIQVRKCNDEIQYKLKPTTWLSAYCFEKQEFLNRSTPFPAPENVNLESITVTPELKFKAKPFDDKLTWNVPYLRFRCQFNNETDLHYTVTWFIDETPLNETMGPSTDMSDFVLNEEHLTSRNISLGIYIRCGVSASIGVDGMPTPMERSARFYAGIKILNTTVFLDKGSSTDIQMEPTVPIGCKYFIGKDTSLTCMTEMKIFVNDGDTLQCERGSILNQVPEEIENQKCAQHIQTLAEGDTWDPSTQFNFTIVTSDHTYEDKDRFILQLQFGETMSQPIWNNYFFPEIKVFVQNTDEYKSKICQSHNDPHMMTADGYRYENHVAGTYMLYINTRYNIEVQQIIKHCAGWANAKCTCAVGISAGQDVFMINLCGKVPYLAFPQCGDGGILDVQRINDYLYKVFTPIGTQIRISPYSGKWMNVDITMAPKDMGNVYGLCGHVDGDKTNDLKHRNSTVTSPLGTARYKYHLEFSESWRIEDDADENLFRPTLRTLSPWVLENGLYCVCNKTERVNEALCSPTQYLECTKQGSITKTKCHIKGRRKRRVGNHSSKEVQRILSKIAGQLSSRTKREDDQEIVITEESKSICRNKISGIPAFTDFTDVGSNDNEENVIQQCEFDISVVKDTSWADVHVEAVNDGVKNMLDLQPTIVENNSEKVETFYVNTCPMNCSSHGECVDPGVCSCFMFYKGPDCSIDERDGINILDIEGGGECDLADGEECECFYVRSLNIQDNFTCSVNTSKILKDGDIEFVSSQTLTGGFEDIFTGICCAPDSIIGRKDVFVAQYTVSLSNNGIHFGKEESVYVFDSSCQSISTSEAASKTFSLKDGHCFVEGYCYSDNDMAPAGCRACQSSKGLYEWTDYDPCQNGGICSDEIVGYSCFCMPGYSGLNCEYEIDECLSEPCQNRGVCTDMFNAYSCECLDGFSGKNCETDIDECSSNPCRNGAFCINDVNRYQCNCSAGYDGTNCDQNINECASDPCQNGGTCKDEIAKYKCECIPGYEGVNCGIEIHECSSTPCQNGGTCTDLLNAYSCKCPDGFYGENCQTDIDECSSNPCRNGASCINDINMYQCNCSDGYEGKQCEHDINECASDPCQNGGTCNDLIANFTCDCVTGYEGSTCGIEINECTPNPCENNGTCNDLVNGYECTCTGGYTGSACEIDINECQSSPCKNGGTCNDFSNGFECSCIQGYGGTFCENVIEQCLSTPCQNGATCTDLGNAYSCKCPDGYSGIHCQNDIDECSSNPCRNGASCINDINMYRCNCSDGYEGTHCEQNINECASDPCQNGGTCKDLVAKFECECVSGYGGVICSIDIGMCISNACKNGGTCYEMVNGNGCACPPGYTGNTCEIDIDECSSNPCRNGAVCINDVNGYQCNCSAGYEGTQCEQNINECASDPCLNGGSCKDLVADFTCECVTGYEGKTCSTEIKECISNPCENGGTCIDVTSGYKCTCADGYTGNNCETVVQSTSWSPVTNIVQKHITIVFQVNAVLNAADPLLKNDVANQLIQHYKSYMGEKFKEIDIQDMRVGSLIVVFEVSYVKDSSSVIDLTNANLDLVRGEKTIEVFNETLTAKSVLIGNVTVTNATVANEDNVCALFTYLNGECEDNLRCSISEGCPACLSDSIDTDDTNDLTVVIVAVVCSVVAFVIIGVAGACVGFHVIHKRKRFRKTRDKFSVRYDGKEESKNPKHIGLYESSFIKGSFKSVSDFLEYSNDNKAGEDAD